MPDIDSINHSGLIAADIDETAAVYERLGFTLTPLSLHQGSWRPGGQVVPFGTGNRCAIFAGNYLEISAHVDRSRDGRGIDGFLDRFAGLHIVCFGCADAAAVDRRLRAEGLTTSGVIPLQREVATPAGPRTARFDCVHVDRQHVPEGRIQAAHHHRPEYVLQERYMRHANGAVALTDTVLCVDDLDGYTELYRRILGRAPRRARAAVVYDLPLGRFTVVDEARLAALLPGERAPALPALVAFGVAVTDPGRTRHELRTRGVRCIDAGERFFVPAAEAGGASVIFEAAA